MTGGDQPHVIEVKVQNLHRLFNSMDPSPFHERDLDHDAEMFIESWAQESPRNAPLKLVVHLSQPPEEPDAQGIVADAIHNYYAYKAALNRNDFRRLMREGWASLLIGILFLAACTYAAQVAGRGGGEMRRIMGEGLTIIGWVAMWRPLEIYLYRWWPVRRLGNDYDKLSAAEVEVRIGGGNPEA